MLFTESLIKCGKIISCLIQYSKNMRNDQKPRGLSCIDVYTHNFKILALLLYGYHTPQLENIAIPVIAVSPKISNFYQPTNWNFLKLVIPLSYNYYY